MKKPNEKIRKLYEETYNKTIITDVDISQAGLSGLEKIMAISYGYMRFTRDGGYEHRDANLFYEMGSKFTSQSNFYGARICFLRAYSIDRYHVGANLHLFL